MDNLLGLVSARLALRVERNQTGMSTETNGFAPNPPADRRAEPHSGWHVP
jgi:hypothetical protein